MENINPSKILSNILKTLLPFAASGLILWWMYRDFNWQEMQHAISHEINWTWMWISMPFGILAQVLRAFRWRQALEPLDEKPRMHTCINAIFMSYASSLLLPRVGEVLRCGILKKFDNTTFTKAIGTVVTERIVDSILMLLLAAATVLLQVKVFSVFIDETGMSIDDYIGQFSNTGIFVTVACCIAVIALAILLARKWTWFSHTKNLFRNIADGILSLRKLKNVPLYVIYSVSIWIAYFLHFYLTFFSFDSTSSLSITAAMVAFVVGSFAVLVPTPNGAGPWHFAVKTILVLYGIGTQQAVMFVLVVHTLQTLLVLLLGIYAMFALTLTRPACQQVESQT